MDIWQELYEKARQVQVCRTLSPFVTSGGVAAAILSRTGQVYLGVCIDTACSLGMCAERNAIASMITQGESRIDKVVAVLYDGSVVPPCGSCRELMMQLDQESGDIEVLLDLEAKKVIKLSELMPVWWGSQEF